MLGGHRAVVRCDATGANFGSDIATFSFGMNSVGCALPTEPPLACSDVEVTRLYFFKLFLFKEASFEFNKSMCCGFCRCVSRKL